MGHCAMWLRVYTVVSSPRCAAESNVRSMRTGVAASNQPRPAKRCSAEPRLDATSPTLLPLMLLLLLPPLGGTACAGPALPAAAVPGGAATTPPLVLLPFPPVARVCGAARAASPPLGATTAEGASVLVMTLGVGAAHAPGAASGVKADSVAPASDTLNPAGAARGSASSVPVEHTPPGAPPSVDEGGGGGAARVAKGAGSACACGAEGWAASAACVTRSGASSNIRRPMLPLILPRRTRSRLLTGGGLGEDEGAGDAPLWLSGDRVMASNN